MRIYEYENSAELKYIDFLKTKYKYYATPEGSIYRKYLGEPRNNGAERKVIIIGNDKFSKLKPYTGVGIRKNRLVGYQNVDIGEKRYAVHRLIAQTFIENPESKKQVNHKDGNIQNNNVSNLEWMTNRENVLHAFRVLGRIPKGGRPKGSKNKPKKYLAVAGI